jgi:hypothetical protein
MLPAVMAFLGAEEPGLQPPADLLVLLMELGEDARKR